MLKIIKNVFFILFFSSQCFAATYYMSNNPCSGNSGWGNGSNANAGTKAAPFLTLQYSIAQMSGSDTLIIDDGTYIGADNVIDNTHEPSNGIADSYTIIKAENPGRVIFDGEGTRSMFLLQGSGFDNGPSYIQFEGLGWYNTLGTLVLVVYSNHIKFVNCWAAEVNGTGQGGGDGFQISYSRHVLLEDCFSWGNVRKHFYIGNSAEYIIVRRCVARHDRYFDYIDQEAFMAYDCRNVEFQNCIAIDGDQHSFYTPEGSAKAFTTRSGGSNVENIYYRGCISIGNDGMVGWTGSGVVGVFVENSIHWDSIYGTRIREVGHSFKNFTTGVISGTGSWSPLAYLEKGDLISNSILYLGYQGIINASSMSDHNVLFGITSEYIGTSAGLHDKSNTNNNAIDPLDGTPGNGTRALQYLVKIQNSSDLDGAASDSGDIGATILYRIGVDDTLYNDDGYNTTTAIKLWPFPNEALIRSKMRAYTYDDGSGGDPEITGARGFAADDHTITEYVLNYLNPANPITVEGTSPNKTTVTASVDEFIYGESGETDEVDPIVAISDSDPKTLLSGYTTTLGFISSDANGIDECKWRSGSAPDESNGTACTGTTSGTCSVTGLVQGDNTIYVGCADPSNNWGSDSITINAPPYRVSASGFYSVH